MPNVMNRKDAFVRSLTKYMTGKPCKHGHVAERRTDTGNCIECQRLAGQTPERKQYMRLYARTKAREAKLLIP